MPYQVWDVTGWEPWKVEPMGSKEKVWLVTPDEQRWLFKEPRALSGEDWAEKIAAGIANELGLPHAEVHLAIRQERHGIISRDFLPDRQSCQLVHGNELLVKLYPDYRPTGPTWGLAQHTVSRVLETLAQAFIHLSPADLPGGVTAPPELFVGYLMLDALVGNTDRHHENWAVVDWQKPAGEPRYSQLAPTFDHASSMGRELSDNLRRQKLAAADRRHGIDGYAARTTSRLYQDETSTRPLSPIDAFLTASRSYRDAGRSWLQRLAQLMIGRLEEAVKNVPEARMSVDARRFAFELLLTIAQRLSP